MRLSNKTTQEQQKQVKLNQHQNNCYELKLPTIFHYFQVATSH